MLGGSTWKSKVACKVAVVFCLIRSYSYLLTVGDIRRTVRRFLLSSSYFFLCSSIFYFSLLIEVSPVFFFPRLLPKVVTPLSCWLDHLSKCCILDDDRSSCILCSLVVVEEGGETEWASNQMMILSSQFVRQEEYANGYFGIFSEISTIFYKRPRLCRSRRWLSSKEGLPGWLYLYRILLNQLLCINQIYILRWGLLHVCPLLDAQLLKILDFQDTKA